MSPYPPILEFSEYKIMSCANRDDCTSLRILLSSFIYFLLAPAKNSSTMLNRSEEYRHHCFVPNLSKMLSNFHH